MFLCNKTANTDGIRIYDGGHTVRNNYVEGLSSTSDTRGAIVVHSGVNVVGDKPALNKQWTAYNYYVGNNTLVEMDGAGAKGLVVLSAKDVGNYNS